MFYMGISTGNLQGELWSRRGLPAVGRATCLGIERLCATSATAIAVRPNRAQVPSSVNVRIDVLPWTFVVRPDRSTDGEHGACLCGPYTIEHARYAARHPRPPVPSYRKSLYRHPGTQSDPIRQERPMLPISTSTLVQLAGTEWVPEPNEALLISLSFQA